MIGNEERIASKGMFKLEELFIDFLLLQSGCIRISNAENWVFAGAVSVWCQLYLCKMLCSITFFDDMEVFQDLIFLYLLF